MYPERQTFLEGSSPPALNLWWQESPELEAAFRRRLGSAKSRGDRAAQTPFGSTLLSLSAATSVSPPWGVHHTCLKRAY